MSGTDLDKWPGAGGIGRKTRALEQAIEDAGSKMDATIDLPERIEPGSFAFTYMADVHGNGDLQAEDIEFEWNGSRWATWTRDISMHEAITPASSAPIYGFASWLNGRDLLLAYSGSDIETEGCARIPGAAPMAPEDDRDEGYVQAEEPLADPQRWVRLARVITAVTYEQELPGMTGERYPLE